MPGSARKSPVAVAVTDHNNPYSEIPNTAAAPGAFDWNYPSFTALFFSFAIALFAFIATFGRIASAFGSLQSEQDSVESLLMDTPKLPISIDADLALSVSSLFCAGNGLMNGMSELRKILSLRDLKNLQPESHLTPYQIVRGYTYAALNALTTGASAYNGFYLVFSTLTSNGTALNAIGGLFGITVCFSSTVFNAKNSFDFCNQDFPLSTPKKRFLFSASSLISFLSNGSMALYQTSLLLSQASVPLSSPITLVLGPLMAIGSNLNLYYTQIPSNKKNIAQGEDLTQSPCTSFGSFFLDLLTFLAEPFYNLYKNIKCERQAFLRLPLHFLIDLSWFLSPFNAPVTIASMLSILTKIVTDTAGLPESSWYNGEVASWSIMGTSLLIGLNSAFSQRNYRSVHAKEQANALIGLLCCVKTSQSKDDQACVLKIAPLQSLRSDPSSQSLLRGDDPKTSGEDLESHSLNPSQNPPAESASRQNSSPIVVRPYSVLMEELLPEEGTGLSVQHISAHR